MQDFLSGRKKVNSQNAPKDTTVPGNSNPSLANVQAITAEEGEPKVELVSENGQIKNIIVTCTCGKRVELKCHY